MDDKRRRARDLGLVLGPYPPGPHDAITDVTGIRVGHATVVEGAGIRTGVTAIVPDAVDRAGGALAAGLFAGNGYGKLTGATQLAELGVIETPVVLTSTLSAFRAADFLVSYMLRLAGNERIISVNPVVGETNDGYLSDIRARPVTERHVLAAVSGARGGPVTEGAVGAGTGTSALGFKAGIGTASRRLWLAAGEPCTLGVLVQANFSGVLTVRGVRVGSRHELWRPADREAAEREAAEREGAAGPRPAAPDQNPADDKSRANSCMIVVAIDHGLDSRQLTRVARRAVFAMARTGADFAGTSGDYAIAVATASVAQVPDSALGPVFAAVQDAVEEAILNSLFMATTTTGFLGRVSHAVPLDLVVRACREAGVLGGQPERIA